ncbi:MAG: LysM peptidoglycan-binding domain-containing protein [SAR324 cluster bacterium]|nr:LysM peptidoglycan-binding domain-containing protein [SAR324 cluster bacterium]
MLLVFISNAHKAANATDLILNKKDHLPLTSFLFANRDQMRVGWYNNEKHAADINSKTTKDKPVGSLFVQLKPRKNEGEYQLALRVLRDGSHQFLRIREFTGGKPLYHKRYLTIPFALLVGVIQGEALRSLFPNDRVELGGWQHQFTYIWETPELLIKTFSNSGTLIFNQAVFKQGEKFTIPWRSIRADLELKPLAVKEPLFIRKDDFGQRFAFYRIQAGDTLYSSVVIRFIGKTKHYARSQNANDLLILNGLKDAHQLAPGQLIKIPLKWIRAEFLHQVPSIYRISDDSISIEKENSSTYLPATGNELQQNNSLLQKNFISLR